MTDPFRWRLLRSPAFWAGIVVMVSMCWAWWDSTRKFMMVSGAGCGVISAGAGLSVGVSNSWGSGFRFHTDELKDGSAGLAEVGMRRPMFLWNHGGPWDDEMFQAAGLRQEGPGDDPLLLMFEPTLTGKRGDWNVYVPYWLVLAVVVTVWGLWLGWRLKSKRRLQALVEEGEIE